MANVFDQFDAPSAKPVQGAPQNVFDQFDAGPTAPTIDWLNRATPSQIAGLSPAARSSLRAQISAQATQPLPPASGSSSGLANFGIGALQGAADVGNAVRQGISAIGRYDPNAGLATDIASGLNTISGMTPGQENAQFNAIYGGSTPATIGRIVGNTAITAPLALATGGASEALLPESTGLLGKAVVNNATQGLIYGMASQPAPGASRLGDILTGGITGGLLPPLFAGGGALAKLGGKGLDLLTSTGRNNLAKSFVGKRLLEIVNNAGTGELLPTLKAPALPGVNQTLGQATDNAGALALEKAAFSTGSGANILKALRSGNNQTILQALKEVSPAIAPFSLDETSGNLANLARSAYEKLSGDESNLWEKVDPTNSVTLPKSGLQQVVNSTYNKLGPTRSMAIRTPVSKILDANPDNVPLMEVKNIRTRLGAEAHAASMNGDNDAAGSLWSMRKALGDYMGSVPVRDVSGQFLNADDAQAVAQRYNAANAFTRQLEGLTETEPLATVLKPGPGGYRVQPESFAAKLLNKGQPEGVTSLQKISELAGSPQTMDAARASLLSKWVHDSSNLSELDKDGAPLVSGTKMFKFYNENRSLFKRLFPTATQDYLTNNIIKAAQRNDAIQNAIGTGGSPTMPNLKMDRFIDELMGHSGITVSPFESGVAGEVAGGLMEGAKGVPGGYIAGRAAGYGGRHIMGGLKRARAQILYQALANPEFGMQIMKSAASPPFANRYAPIARNFLLPSLIRGLQASTASPENQQ